MAKHNNLRLSYGKSVCFQLGKIDYAVKMYEVKKLEDLIKLKIFKIKVTKKSLALDSFNG